MRRHRWEKKQAEVSRAQRDEARDRNQRKQDVPAEEEHVDGVAGVDLSPLWAPFDTLFYSGTNPPVAPRTYQYPLGQAYLSVPPAPTRAPLPVRQQAEPIVAWKRARIKVHDGHPVLCGVVFGRYKPVDVAQHLGIWDSVFQMPAHVAPDLDCACGFYGVAKDHLYDASFDYHARSCADLEVELYGKVIAHEQGWRAEKQRVLAVHLDLFCRLCRRPASGVADLGVTCARCAPTLFTPADLASEWGVEVRWQEAPR